VPRGDHVSEGNGIHVPFANMRDWERGDHVSNECRDDGPTTYRFSVMGVPVGEVTCDSNVLDNANAIFGGAHIDIASGTSRAPDYVADICVTYNSGDGVVADQLPRDSAYDFEHGTMLMIDNGDPVSGKNEMMGRGDAPEI
jgi:hypothetical protein